ncbi:ACP phosphodiesterase [Shewanella algidipiscicola]|uniref:acyl carrier protein phosphodiesterase n=1 Tax=Shewanella algidipiscicola TaxID=614070 RepID=UPI000D78AB85|nr:ACP phosphodiesterase [Shewanella algidipiscicola]
MNFLAHLHLADNSKTSLGANLAGDFAKGKISDHPKPLQQGIWLHRQINSLTDSHELTKELRAAFPAQLQRAAPILIDLAFDHMLAKYWDEYHNQSLSQFADHAYTTLEATPHLPQNLLDIIPAMRQQNWLVAYEAQDGLHQAINSVAKRVSKPDIFDGAVDTVIKMDIDIEIAFRTFYPQLMAYSRIWTRQTPSDYL